MAPLPVGSVYSIPLFFFVHSDTDNTFCRPEQVPEEVAVVPLVGFASCDKHGMDSFDSSSRCFP